MKQIKHILEFTAFFYLVAHTLASISETFTQVFFNLVLGVVVGLGLLVRMDNLTRKKRKFKPTSLIQVLTRLIMLLSLTYTCFVLITSKSTMNPYMACICAFGVALYIRDINYTYIR